MKKHAAAYYIPGLPICLKDPPLFTVAILALLICYSALFSKETMAPRTTDRAICLVIRGIYDDRHMQFS